MTHEVEQIGNLAFEVIGRVTKPLLSMKHQPLLYVKILSEPAESDIVIGETRGKEKMKVAEVVNLLTGEESLLICSTVVLSTFEKLKGDNPDAPVSIVGRCFKLKSGDIKEGKKYRTVDIYEIREASPSPVTPTPVTVPTPAPEPAVGKQHKK